MKSQWYELKEQAIGLRKRGSSLRVVEAKLKIPRSTLSGWFRGVRLSASQREKLLRDKRASLIRARKKAVLWHKSQKAARLALAKSQALQTLAKIDLSNKNVLDLALAMLYLGEGFKSAPQTAIGSSNPLILKFFLKALGRVYGLNPENVKCEMHLRADQNPTVIKKFWSKELEVPLKNFTSVSVDLRTKGSTTYEHYKGVCVLQCSNSAVQRKLLYLADEFCRSVLLL